MSGQISDVNFCYPIRPVSNSRVHLEPFVPEKHLKLLFDGIQGHQDELWKFMPMGPYPTLQSLISYYKTTIQPYEDRCWFAVQAKASPEDTAVDLAGIIGLLDTNTKHATTEIGYIVIMPKYQRTFVASNAAGLLLHFVFEHPPNGLGLRRCQWQTHNANEGSKRVALRMGFAFEGVQRFQRTIPRQKMGNGFEVSSLPESTGKDLGPSRDSALFAHYCDEWEEKKQAVQKAMDRQG